MKYAGSIGLGLLSFVFISILLSRFTLGPHLHFVGIFSCCLLIVSASMWQGVLAITIFCYVAEVLAGAPHGVFILPAVLASQVAWRFWPRGPLVTLRRRILLFFGCGFLLEMFATFAANVAGHPADFSVAMAVVSGFWGALLGLPMLFVLQRGVWRSERG